MKLVDLCFVHQSVDQALSGRHFYSDAIDNQFGHGMNICRLLDPAKRRCYHRAVESFKSAVAYFILLAAVVHLIVFHLAPDAPVWQNQSTNSAQLSMERRLDAVDKQFLTDADGGNLELHFVGFDADEFHQGLLLSQFYFRANYALYPHRSFIGRSDRVLNTPPQMAAADVIPDEHWLKEHDVHTVRTLIQAPNGVYGESRRGN